MFALISNYMVEIGDLMRRGRLRWQGHVERKDDADYVKTCTRLVVEGNRDLARNEEFSEIAVINIFLVLKKKNSYLWGGGPAGKISR